LAEPTNTELILVEIRELRVQVTALVTDGQLLRKELGTDSGHGRLPSLEGQMAKLETRTETLEQRLRTLEMAETLLMGQRKSLSLVWSLLTGSAGAAIVGVVAHVLGFIH
jgi:hypothetical protein